MTCNSFRFGPDAKGVAIVCSRGGRRKAPCSVAGCGRDHTKLCDHPVARRHRFKGKLPSATCDAKLCDGHAVPQGPDRDYCPAHAKKAASSPPERATAEVLPTVRQRAEQACETAGLDKSVLDHPVARPKKTIDVEADSTAPPADPQKDLFE
jgi:hypothetical protein